MSALSAGLKVLARRLLAWDVDRINAAAARGVEDLEEYRARQELARQCIDADVETWPPEVRRLFRAVLETTGTGRRARQIGIAPPRPFLKRLTAEDRIAYRELAEAIGVLERLREAGPADWTATPPKGGS